MSDPTSGDEGAPALPASVPNSQAEQMGGKDDERILWWMRQIEESRHREKDWRKAALETVDLYEAVKEKDYQFNILYSNTEILSPALYNKTPRPVCVRRFRDADPLGHVACDIVKRLLSFFADTNEFEFSDFDTNMRADVLSALVPGRGTTRFKHEVEFYTPPPPEGQPDVKPKQKIRYECVVGEHIPWDRITHGYAKQWRHVPWLAIDHYMDREELVANFGDVGKTVELTETEKDSEQGKTSDKWTRKGDGDKGVKLAMVHEIWNKVTRQVLFVSPGYTKGFLRETDDPLDLTGFFPLPEPLRFFDKIKTLTPTCLYTQYKEQHKELNRLTTRINRIIGACKVRGMYDKRVSGIDRLLQQDDNTLLPAENMSQIGDTANLDKAIWLMPIERLVAVLQQLYLNRQEVKAVIYEIMGISDILRGSSKASETLGAQEIKDQWGSLRVSRMQGKVQKYARDCFRIMAEIAVTKLDINTIAKITGLQIPFAAQKQQAMAVVQQWQQMQSLAMAGQQGQPAQNQQPPAQVQQAMALTQQPAWEEVMAVLRDCLTRSYRIDIETNSTIDPEATDDKQQIVDLMNGLAQMMSGFAPLVESGAMPPDAIKGILMTVSRRFRFGDEIEQYLNQMSAPQQKPDPKAQAIAAQAQIELQKSQMDFQLAQQKNGLDAQDMQRKAGFKEQEHTLKMQELLMKMEMMKQEHALALETAQVRARAEIISAQTKVQAAHAMPKKPGGKSA